MSAPETAPYEALAALIERELELLGESRLEELAQLKLARTELLQSMPAMPPAAAGEMLERCALLQQRVRIEILRVREAVLLELVQVGGGPRGAPAGGVRDPARAGGGAAGACAAGACGPARRRLRASANPAADLH